MPASNANVYIANTMAHKTESREPQTAKTVYVFSSDLAGRHTRGTALIALREHGAVYGEAVGLRGRSYAIPVRDEQGDPLPLRVITRYVQAFLRFASNHRDLTFQVTRIGCEAGVYSEREMAPLFAQAPLNCLLPRKWRTA